MPSRHYTYIAIYYSSGACSEKKESMKCFLGFLSTFSLRSSSAYSLLLPLNVPSFELESQNIRNKLKESVLEIYFVSRWTLPSPRIFEWNTTFLGSMICWYLRRIEIDNHCSTLMQPLIALVKIIKLKIQREVYKINKMSGKICFLWPHRNDILLKHHLENKVETGA